MKGYLKISFKVTRLKSTNQPAKKRTGSAIKKYINVRTSIPFAKRIYSAKMVISVIKVRLAEIRKNPITIDQAQARISP